MTEIGAVIDAQAAVRLSRRPGAIAARLAALGEWLRRHTGLIHAMQWSIVAAYAFFVAVPAFLPLPADDAHWYNSLAVLAQWLFWGLWWPSVILSMFVLGRTWCGLFCPEGVLTEAASRHGLGRAVPRWLKWAGWPFVVFALTTVFGQLVSVYQYPAATMLVLGGSTLAAVGVGLVYGRGKRVWCRHLCPVNGVFAVLSRLSPLHYRVDTAAWSVNVARIRVHPVNCAPLVRIRRMTGPSECHMCARCSGLHGAIALAARSPNHEVATLDASAARAWDAALIVFGMIGLALGAFEWSAMSAFVSLRSAAITLVVDHGPAWLLANNAPWWLLTNYPEVHDVFTWLDGALIIGWIVCTALLIGGWLCLWLAVAARSLRGAWRSNAFALAYALTPLAGAGLLVGLSGLSATLAHGEGLRLAWLPLARAALLILGGAWSVWLAQQQIGMRVGGTRRVLALSAVAMAIAGVLAAWVPFVFRVI
ncbi:MAG: 4Fe-4S binding protein [Aromatoleum sp.]|nr:4Fe-4S binding protein [Aromatoleum sp.]